ncbi:MAG: hypothetical protein QG552_177 [Thermodesulfobacteriota bacterium]|nr:hypothetical protein [Thermodesulfobacteriota bacterium]
MRSSKMTKIDRVLKKISDLYEFNRKLKAYELKEKERANKSLKEDATKAAPLSFPLHLQKS